MFPAGALHVRKDNCGKISWPDSPKIVFLGSFTGINNKLNECSSVNKHSLSFYFVRKAPEEHCLCLQCCQTHLNGLIKSFSNCSWEIQKWLQVTHDLLQLHMMHNAVPAFSCLEFVENNFRVDASYNSFFVPILIALVNINLKLTLHHK